MTLRTLYFFCIISLLSACTKQVGYVNTGRYPDEIDRIMSKSCATSGCHNAASAGAANNLNLSTWTDMFKGSGSGSPVIPFSSRFSSLCYFINTYSDLGAINVPSMPLNQTPLSREEVQRVKAWIDEGAPNAEGEIPFGTNVLRKKLYAVNQGCDVVTVFDSETHLPMRFIEVGKGKSTPHQVRVSPDGKFWFVLFLNSNVMKKYRCSDDAFVADIPLTPAAAGSGSADAIDWNTFVITKDSKRAYCVSWTALGAVATLDLVNEKLIRYTPGFKYPHGICLSKDEKKVYIAAQTGNYITEIDSSFDVSTINEYGLDGGAINTATSLDPHDMALSPNGSQLIVTCQKSNEVIVFDLQTHQPVKRIATPVYPQEIIYSSLFHAYYIACSGDGTLTEPGAVLKIDEQGYSSSSAKIGAQPHGLAVDETTGILYLLSRNISSNGPIPHHTSQCAGRNGFVTLINPANLKLTGEKFEMSVDPYFIYVRP